MDHPARLFYSYSHKDEMLRNELETHLKLLQRQGLIEPWHDRNIEAGDDWRTCVDENIERADIILLLVSADFIASDYPYGMEMARVLERHETGDAKVVPVIVRDLNWKRAPFGMLSSLPANDMAVTMWPSRNAAWQHVVRAIGTMAEEIRNRRRRLEMTESAVRRFAEESQIIREGSGIAGL